MSESVVSSKFLFFSPPADGSRPWYNIDYDPITGIRHQNWEYEPHFLDVENIRGKEASVTLDTAGFQFFHHPASHKSFANSKDIEREYYPESIEFLKKVTGASRVVIFDHSMSFPERYCRWSRAHIHGSHSHTTPPPGRDPGRPGKKAAVRISSR